MSRFKRGGYLFETWGGDHSPRQVHVYRDRVLVAKWDLDGWKPMTGRPSGRVVRLLEELREEGRL